MNQSAPLKQWNKNAYKNLWQHSIWRDFQKAIGRQTWLIKQEKASALIVKHSLPKGLCWLEVPRGPLFEDKKSLHFILDEIQKIGKKENAIFVRLSSYGKLEIKNGKLKIATHDHHPSTSLIIDLKLSEEEILKQMKPKGRYNIKVAQKNNVTVKPSKDIDTFYKILSTTGNRDGFGIHKKSYYEKILKSLGNHAQLLLAEYKGKIIAGGIFVYLDQFAIYYYGASDNDYRNTMAPYLIQWEAIKEAKKRHCCYYDFLGISPEGSVHHAWAGVTQFKKKFGGEIVSYPTAKDKVLKPFWYWAYRLYKRLKR